MIKLKWTKVAESERVYLENRHAGDIKRVEDGWQYFPEGQAEGGDVYATLSECESDVCWGETVTREY